jgi:hypothetical protein
MAKNPRHIYRQLTPEERERLAKVRELAKKAFLPKAKGAAPGLPIQDRGNGKQQQ